MGYLDWDERYRQIGLRPTPTIGSPAENGGALRVLLPPVLCLEKANHDPVVTIFSAGHFIPDQNFFVFIRHIAQASELVKTIDARIVLLGLEPLDSDAVHGYIVPGAELANAGGASLKRVEILAKRPIKETGRELVRSGALWNTLVFACKLETLSNAIQCTSRSLYRSLQAISDGINASDEKPAIEQVYRPLCRLDFFNDVLQNLSYEDRPNVFVLSVRVRLWAGALVKSMASHDIVLTLRSVVPCSASFRCQAGGMDGRRISNAIQYRD